MKATILNITYGNKPYCTENGFLPISAGSNREGILCDNTGDNISEKNKWYGELTALYWAWKNLKGVDIIGESHYRRFLIKKKRIIQDTYVISSDAIKRSKLYKPTLFIEDLDRYDMIIPVRKQIGDMSVMSLFLKSHHCEDIIDTMRNVMKDIHPEALDVYDKYFSGDISFYCCLFITKWERFDHMMKWCFDYLFELENRLDLSKYDGYQSRIIAFIYERIINVYVLSQNLAVKEYPILKIEDRPCESLFYQDMIPYRRRPKLRKYIFKPLERVGVFKSYTI